MSRARNNFGYTLIELVLVIAIIGILAVSTVPAWFDRARTNLDITKRRMVCDLNFAREYAITTHNQVSAKFNVAGNSYAIYATATGVDLQDPPNASGTLSMTLNGANNTGGVAIAAANLGGTPGLRFNTWGAPCDSAGNVLSGSGVITLTSGAYADTIRVEAGTGFTR
jgi:prepilin-type N-terminal cleavage/methylation domain-containing protein